MGNINGVIVMDSSFVRMECPILGPLCETENNVENLVRASPSG